jgi:hypothetical protein
VKCKSVDQTVLNGPLKLSTATALTGDSVLIDLF